MLHSSHQMGPIDQSLQAIRNFFKAFVIIGKSGWRWLYFLPFIVYLILLFSGLYLTSDLHKHAMSLLEENVLNYEGDNTFYNILFSASSILTWIIIKIGLFILFGIISASATIILLSPVFAYISEKTEEQLRGVSYPFNIQKFLKDILRAVIIAIRNGVLQLIIVVVLFLLSFIPILNLITTPLLFIISAYFYGFSFLDYAHERMSLTMKQSIIEVRKLKFGATILGGIFLLLSMIPWIGPLVAGLFSFHLVIAGTLLVLEGKLE